MILRNVDHNVLFKVDTIAGLSTLMRSEKSVSFPLMILLAFRLDFNKTGISLLVNEEDAIRVLVIMMESRVRREKKQSNKNNISFHE